MPEKTAEELALEKAQEQFARDVEALQKENEKLEKAQEELAKDLETFQEEKAAFEAAKPGPEPKAEKVKPWTRKKEYTVKSDLMYGKKVLVDGNKNSLKNLSGAQVKRLESEGIIQ